ITLCPSPLPAANVQRFLTVSGSTFNASTTASWQPPGATAPAPITPLTVQFVNSGLIRLIIPATLATTPTTGTIRVTTAGATLAAPYSFGPTTPPIIVCSTDIAEVTAGRQPFPVAIYGLGLNLPASINGVRTNGNVLLSSSPVSQVQGAGTIATVVMQADW